MIRIYPIPKGEEHGHANCPNCLMKAYVYQGRDGRYWVECADCDLSTTKKKSLKTAIRLWNKKVYDLLG